MYDFGITSMALARHKKLINHFIADSLGIERGNNSWLTKLKLRFWKVSVERQMEYPVETIRIFKGKKLIKETSIIFKSPWSNLDNKGENEKFS